nr:hypothetical protein [Tanacetum cinerariifolium]
MFIDEAWDIEDIGSCFNGISATSNMIDEVKLLFTVNGNMSIKDFSTQIYTILKQPDLGYLTQELLTTHPGLEFLQSTLEIQERYGCGFGQFLRMQSNVDRGIDGDVGCWNIEINGDVDISL